MSKRRDYFDKAPHPSGFYVLREAIAALEYDAALTHKNGDPEAARAARHYAAAFRRMVNEGTTWTEAFDFPRQEPAA